MYCRVCGNEVNDNAEICVKCGCRPLNGKEFCQECGAVTLEKQEICTKCGVRLKTMVNNTNNIIIGFIFFFILFFIKKLLSDTHIYLVRSFPSLSLENSYYINKITSFGIIFSKFGDFMHYNSSINLSFM